VNAHSEHFETAMQHAQKALRLSPFDPLNYHPYGALALVYLFTDRFEEAVKYSNLAVQSNPAFSVFHTLLVASYASLDRLDLARAAAQQLLEIASGFSVAGFVRMGVYRQPQMDKIAEALHRVGLLD
ncbi:MAG: adenylate cyclase, partial [Mesorhizobium sp.]